MVDEQLSRYTNTPLEKKQYDQVAIPKVKIGNPFPRMTRRKRRASTNLYVDGWNIKIFNRGRPLAIRPLTD